MVLEIIIVQLLSIWLRYFYESTAVDPCFMEPEIRSGPFNKKENKYKSTNIKLGMKINFFRRRKS